MVGRCQVLYVVNPKQFNTVDDADYTELCRGLKVVEVTKTVNYSNCEGLNEDSYGIPLGYKKYEGSFDSNIFNVIITSFFIETVDIGLERGGYYINSNFLVYVPGTEFLNVS